MSQTMVENKEAKVSMLDWQLRLALMLHEPHDSVRELLRSSLALLVNVYFPSGMYAATFDHDGNLRDICLVGDVNETDIRRGLLDALVQADRTVTTAGGRNVAVPLRARDQVIGIIALTGSKRAPFDKAMLFDLEAAAQLIGSAAAAMIRQEKAQNEQNRQAQLQHDLTAMTYHDLRAPLQNVQTSFAAIERLLNPSTDERVSELAQAGARSARQIGRMIRSLLDVERLENGSIHLHPQSIPLAEVMQDVIEIVAPLAADADHRLQVEIDPTMPAVMVDSNLIERVLVNLIENGIKYTPSGGSIHVTGTRKGNSAYISVIDDGPGIPYNLREAIFDKFYRINSTSGRDGLGLGLAFCRLAIEAHGGRIWVEGEDMARILYLRCRWTHHRRYRLGKTH
ncbi:MAG: putative two-component sensor histidine kinase [Chloroflexi bacterium OLB15]|nr:MAG: putative two-component sensor histidine kinase [Chloroflexi bacterium OLB15]